MLIPLRKLLIWHVAKVPISAFGKSSRRAAGTDTSSVRLVNHHPIASNCRFSFCGVSTEFMPVCGWRFAPACCAAQSVIRRGLSCAVPSYRLAWAAQLAAPQQASPIQRFVSENGNMHHTSFSRRQANQAARPNHSLNRTYCGGPAFGLQKPSPNTSPPQ